jgi:predicted transcriptional regulator
MANTTVTLDLPEGLWKDIDFAAFGEGIPPAQLVAKVMQAYLETADRAALEQGMRDIESGNVIDHEDVLRWFESIRTKASQAA